MPLVLKEYNLVIACILENDANRVTSMPVSVLQICGSDILTYNGNVHSSLFQSVLWA
jgi:hypothetical protein